MDKKIGSLFGDNDLAPILQVPKGPAEELSEEEYLAQYGPPFGPCGHPCSCRRCQDYRAQLKKQGPPVKRIPVIKRDDFDRAIEEVLAREPREEWRETIRQQHCFARCWHDADDRSFCTEMECDLRSLCESTWEGVRGGTIERDEDDSIIVPSEYRLMGSRVLKGVLPRKSKIHRNKWKGVGKYSRVPYIDQGRPIDKIVYELWQYLGNPPSLPNGWAYLSSGTKEQEEQARNAFVAVMGNGLYVTRRASYHQYINNGYHFLRIWVNGASGGWVDCPLSLARIMLTDSKNSIEKTPESGKKTKFRFYPYRVFISKPSSLDRLKIALTKLPGFEYLSKDR
jgi:hypothetical protein